MSEKKLTGIGVSAGIAIGEVFLLHSDQVIVPQRQLTADQEIESEIARFKSAVAKTKEQLLNLKEKVSNELGPTEAEIFETHLLALEDPVLIEETIERIKQDRVNAEYAFSQVLEREIAAFSRIGDLFLKERAMDFRDVGRRIIANLLGEGTQLADVLSTLPKESIIIAHDLTPSDTASLQKDRIIGFATDIGSHTSHTAIMARALEIPAVVGLHSITAEVKLGDLVILDGTNGIVIVNPEPATLEHYKELQRKYIYFTKELEENLRNLPAETTDGYRILLAANIELPEEVDHVKKHGANGIGLYRTEFLYMNRSDLPSEDEQFEVYKYVAESVAPDPVIIRTLDIGGDKFASSLKIPEEMQPFLGCRAIRFCLERPDIFSAQLRAILRASAYGNVKIMYPMISGVKELRIANNALLQAKQELRQAGKSFNENIEVGVMIELPSAAMVADLLAKEANFFSIGTNDLIQYTLAISRRDERVAYLYDPLHPAVIRFIQRTVEAAHNANIPVGLCGEMAAEPIFTILLVGLELDELSMGPVAIPQIKKIIRSISFKEAKELANTIIGLTTSDEIRGYLKQRVKEILPFLPS